MRGLPVFSGLNGVSAEDVDVEGAELAGEPMRDSGPGYPSGSWDAGLLADAATAPTEWWRS